MAAIKGFFECFWVLAQVIRAQAATKNIAALSPRSGLNGSRIRILTPPLLYAPRSAGPDGLGLVLV